MIRKIEDVERDVVTALTMSCDSMMTIARQIDYSKSTVYGISNGKIELKNCSFGLVVALCEHLNVELCRDDYNDGK